MTMPNQYSNHLHPPRNGLRTSLMAAACTVALITPIAWVLHQIGALS